MQEYKACGLSCQLGYLRRLHTHPSIGARGERPIAIADTPYRAAALPGLAPTLRPTGTAPSRSENYKCPSTCRFFEVRLILAVLAAFQRRHALLRAPDVKEALSPRDLRFLYSTPVVVAEVMGAHRRDVRV